MLLQLLDQTTVSANRYLDFSISLYKRTLSLPSDFCHSTVIVTKLRV